MDRYLVISSDKKQIVETFHDVPEEELALMLGENAARLFGFDTEKSNALAARIGPLKSDFVTSPTHQTKETS